MWISVKVNNKCLVKFKAISSKIDECNNINIAWGLNFLWSYSAWLIFFKSPWYSNKNSWFPSNSTDNGDDFQTPMSTPPSEAEDEGKGATTTTAADLSSLSLSEAQLYDRLYERCVT